VDEVGRGNLSASQEAEVLEKLPAFDPGTARASRGNGALVEFLRTCPGSRVNRHVARFVACGRQAEHLFSHQPWNYRVRTRLGSRPLRRDGGPRFASRQNEARPRNDVWCSRSGEDAMKWVTRQHARVNRIATAWLVRRFIDPAAEFVFVAAEAVADLQRKQGAKGFDAPGATYPHRDAQGRCSFEALVDEHCSDDLALQAIARIVHCADFPDAPQTEPAAAGLRAISRGFPMAAKDDHEALSRASFLYDALYASLREQSGRVSREGSGA
jgi:hypothetical protein